MAGPEKYGLCTYKIVTNDECKYRKLDVTGDIYDDKVLVCEKATVEWQGSTEQCRKQFGEIFPDKLDSFEGTRGTFETPIVKLESVGAPVGVCGENFEDLRGKFGIKEVLSEKDGDIGCYIRPYGSQKWFLSYPPQKDGGVKFKDLKELGWSGFVKFNVGDSWLGIGDIVELSLKDGSKAKGMVIQFGFVSLGRAKITPQPTDSKAVLTSSRPYLVNIDPQFSRKNFNVYLLTPRTTDKNPKGRIVDLSDIASFKMIFDEDPEYNKIIEMFDRRHSSVKDLLEELEKLSPTTEGPIEL